MFNPVSYQVTSCEYFCVAFIREEVRREMVESQCKVYISFPIHLERPHLVSTSAPSCRPIHV